MKIQKPIKSPDVFLSACFLHEVFRERTFLNVSELWVKVLRVEKKIIAIFNFSQDSWNFGVEFSLLTKQKHTEKTFLLEEAIKYYFLEILTLASTRIHN